MKELRGSGWRDTIQISEMPFGCLKETCLMSQEITKGGGGGLSLNQTYVLSANEQGEDRI